MDTYSEKGQERMKALVTGAAGLIGSHVSRYLLNRALNVIAVDELELGVS